MKKWISICMIAILLCSTGCQVKKEKIQTDNLGEQYVLGQDAQPYIRQLYTGLALSPEGCYMNIDSKLYFRDSKQNVTVEVCNKADCNHEVEDCYANMGKFDDVIYYYDNDIYAVATEVKNLGVNYKDLYRISKDGSNREKLYTLFVQSEEATEQGISYEMLIHRGYIYYFFEEGFDDVRTSCIYRRKLEKGAKEEVVYQKKGIGVTFYMKIVGNKMYLEEHERKDDTLQIRALQHDIDTNETTILKEDIAQFVNVGENIYYTKDEKIVKLNIKTKKEEVIYQNKEVKDSTLVSDGTYLYLDNIYSYYIKGETKSFEGRKVTAMDVEGTVLDQWQLDNDDNFMGGDEQYLYFYRISNNERKFYVYNKENLGTGKWIEEDYWVQ